MAQLFADRRRHGGETPLRAWLREAHDAARTGPRLRLEQTMTRTTVLVVLTFIAVFSALRGGALGIVIALAVGVLWAIAWRDRPVATGQGRTWWRWLVGAAIGLAVTMVVLAVDGDDEGELSSLGWTLAFVCGNAAIVAGVIGAGLGVLHLVQRDHSAAA